MLSQDLPALSSYIVSSWLKFSRENAKCLLLTQIKLLDMDKYNTVTTNSCTSCVTQFSSRNAATLGVSRKYYTLLTMITLMLHVLRAFFCIGHKKDMAGKTVIAYLLCDLKNSSGKSSSLFIVFFITTFTWVKLLVFRISHSICFFPLL